MEHDDVEKLINSGKFTNPHAFLGINRYENDSFFIRLWSPESNVCQIKIDEKIVEAVSAGYPGLFFCKLSHEITSLQYKISYGKNWAYDPYVFKQSLGELDVHLLKEGLHYEFYDRMGSNLCILEGVRGMSFSVWAPNARAVFLKGEFNGFSNRSNPMRKVEGTGIWELFVPGIANGEHYLYEIISSKGEVFVKTDPVSHHLENRPGHKSIVFDMGSGAWSDHKWMEKRRKFKKGTLPLNIYEVHLGSWKRGSNKFLNYRTLAHELAKYCKQMHFSHVELMGVCEHPLDESWGYQVTGYFAPTSRHGNPADFQYMINYLHNEDIGVFLDWVPGHFPTDSYSLYQFDGTYLYEHMDKRQGYHPHWNTHIFNYGRWEVSNFLIASAIFWLEKMHIDGLRVDAVSSMLHLDFGRNPGEWIPNEDGTNINLEALKFLRHLNTVVSKRMPDVLMIAEESNAFPGITKPVDENGVGFDLKWNLGWMNDTLKFFMAPFEKRRKSLADLALTHQYAFDEKFILVLSHDEVVHCKKSLFSKMPGSKSLQFSGIRNFFAYTMSFPGKKLLFMGGEFGQPCEWNCKEELPWDLLEKEENRKLHLMVQSLNALYSSNPALYERDHNPSSFEWIISGDAQNLVFAFLRKGGGQRLLCVHHFGPEPIESYSIFLESSKNVYERFNTDSTQWGGSGMVNSEIIVESGALKLRLPPLSTLLIDLQ